MTKVFSNGKPDKSILHGEAVDSLLEIELLYDAVKQVEPAKLLPEDDCSLGLLSRAVELKAKGKPYSELGRF